MQDFTTKTDLTNYLNTAAKGKTIGFVPTMGALHKGHLSLIEESNYTCDITICSIFINPTQFNNTEDLAKYPTPLAKDLSLLKKTNCDIVYYPQANDLYISGEGATNYNFGNIAVLMEGKHRPGHFNGVATIVEKLFRIIKPTKAFFGQKDLQQVQIVKALVKQIKKPIEIISLPTIREKSGLAKSSRNQLLDAIDKKNASFIYKSLLYCKKNKSKGVKKLKKYVCELINSNKNIELEYVEFINLEKMETIQDWKGENKSAICIAAYVSGVRLIDNIIL